MGKCISVLAFFLCLATTAAQAGELTLSHQQVVQRTTKTENLLVSEIPQLVGQWTDRCSDKETANDPHTSRCWRDAAAALTRYRQGISERLIKQVEQLQTTWLERAAQLQESSTSTPTIPEAASVAPDANRVLSRQVFPRERKPGSSGKQATSSTTSDKPVVKPKKPIRPSRMVKQRRKIKVEPAAVQPSVRARGHSTSRTTIRQQLENIAKKVECLTVKCSIDKRRIY
ncbi:MAG TPA: hypothetical protein VH933_14755 [Aestuariivirgaceae bacterium]|jgi:hypothetical protein